MRYTETEIINKLDILTSEADMLTEVLHNAVKKYEHKEGMASVSYLLEIIRKKFDDIREVF